MEPPPIIEDLKASMPKIFESIGRLYKEALAQASMAEKMVLDL